MLHLLRMPLKVNIMSTTTFSLMSVLILSNDFLIDFQGPSKSPPRPVPNRFASVAPLFFFPLMNRFDQSITTLDLLGQDSLVLGNLLYMLGTVMYAATNIPLASAMATALLDFLWALKYHPSV